MLTCTPEAFAAAVQAAPRSGAAFRSASGETLDDLLARLRPLFFDPASMPMVTSKTPAGRPGHPRRRAPTTSTSASRWRTSTASRSGTAELAAGANGRGLVEEVYRVGGRYGTARAIVATSRRRSRSPPADWRGARRADHASTAPARRPIGVAYDIAWVDDSDAPVDTINGFVEVYLDARGVKGAWEALVFYVNHEKTDAIRTLRRARAVVRGPHAVGPEVPQAERHGRDGPRHRVVIETGDSGPVTPVGINLPNDQEIREHVRQQVGVALERQRGIREVHVAGLPHGVRWDASEVARARRMGRVRAES